MAPFLASARRQLILIFDKVPRLEPSRRTE
jgi:hypothetical protein